jgi:hypothetical protein
MPLLTSVVSVSLAVEGAGLGATLCSISVLSVLPDQKLKAVSWLEGDLQEESLLMGNILVLLCGQRR